MGVHQEASRWTWREPHGGSIVVVGHRGDTMGTREGTLWGSNRCQD